MNREAFLDKGERVFVATVGLVLAVEVLCTIVGTGTQFAWPRLILGVFGGVFILFLAQRLYGGDHAIERIALAWAAFQIVLALASLVVGPDPRTGGLRFLQDTGVPWRSLALLKLIAYAAFAASLYLRSSPRAFLAAKRGDQVDHYLPPTVVDDTSPLSLTPAQSQVFGSLSSWMIAAAVVLMLVGVYTILYAIPTTLNIAAGKPLSLLEGILIFGLGALLLAPALALGGSGEAGVNTVGRLQAAVRHLTLWHFAAGAVSLALVVTVVVRFLRQWSA
jgi:hypothetical protein